MQPVILIFKLCFSVPLGLCIYDGANPDRVSKHFRDTVTSCGNLAVTVATQSPNSWTVLM